MNWNGSSFGMMGGWDGWTWPFMGVIPLLLLALLIGGVVLIARHLGSDRAPPIGRNPALDALGERYAQGEITREEFLQKKNDIVG